MPRKWRLNLVSAQRLLGGSDSLSKAALFTVTGDLIKEINSPIYRFIWKGNDKIKRAALINDIEDGGLKMLDIQSMILALRVMV